MTYCDLLTMNFVCLFIVSVKHPASWQYFAKKQYTLFKPKHLFVPVVAFCIKDLGGEYFLNIHLEPETRTCKFLQNFLKYFCTVNYGHNEISRNMLYKWETKNQSIF